MSTFYVWDLLPMLAIAALIVAFFVRNRRMKREEDQLKETLQALRAEADTDRDNEIEEKQGI